MNKLKKEDGIALILALIMLLILSALAVSISFMSNNDFQMMSNYKKGQEAFLAAESCVEKGREKFETGGGEGTAIVALRQQSNDPTLSVRSGQDDFPKLPNGAVCRTGPRNYKSSDGLIPFIAIPPTTKNSGRPIRNVSIDRARFVPNTFLVTGKDAGDKDKDDTKDDINTGTEISAGFEVFIPGGELNAY